jgi:uncharacterized protein YndB with AHSA1/START domain
MKRPTFVYVTYIATTPEKVWRALVDSEMTRNYWARHDNVSDWKPGSRWTHQDADNPTLVDVVGIVIESSPPRRLVLSWANPSDEQNRARHSRVTFDIEPMMDAVRLTVTHDELEADSPMLHGISKGWPFVLSSLKTLLETGRALPMTMKRMTAPPA